jgi:hypothetical protein
MAAHLVCGHRRYEEAEVMCRAANDPDHIS